MYYKVTQVISHSMAASKLCDSLAICLTLKILSAVLGMAAGEYVGTMSVNSSAKLLTSVSNPMRGLKGAAIFLSASSPQSIALN